MPAVSDLPLVNAILNCTSTVLLLIGYRFIRRGEVHRHHLSMIGALVSSCLFLISYIVYHVNVGSVPFRGAGWVRPVYFSILISHSILAATIPFLAVVTLVFALKQSFRRHKAIARWTLPCWLYVSVTGVVIYLMLYRLYPGT